ncbi:ataxin-3-like isoform X2 [Leptotrombidium deliense]|uniref:Ataxin-3 homolog n=1 Tax=Leptotrombidium deliense TaxID=299467 RepID=A0A443SFD5_9ACAR|nr:ataxin-3-like isoform X2 [Leptotrombidium deliense]
MGTARSLKNLRDVFAMETVFHEKQEGQLCAKHCLNALLQAPYFTEFDLATIAEQIDAEEKSQMAEGGENNIEYLQFVARPSENLDDSGYFSVQVIERALKVWGLDLIPFNSKNEVAEKARQDPTSRKAYICNYRDHWFTIRKIGQQWFNLNSLLEGPELISDTYLLLFLSQLQQEGYSIFVISGILPACKSDDVLSHTMVTQTEKPKLILKLKKSVIGNPETSNDLETAIALSLETKAEDERKQLEAAIALSLQM